MVLKLGFEVGDHDFLKIFDLRVIVWTSEARNVFRSRVVHAGNSRAPYDVSKPLNGAET